MSSVSTITFVSTIPFVSTGTGTGTGTAALGYKRSMISLLRKYTSVGTASQSCPDCDPAEREYCRLHCEKCNAGKKCIVKAHQ